MSAPHHQPISEPPTLDAGVGDRERDAGPRGELGRLGRTCARLDREVGGHPQCEHREGQGEHAHTEGETARLRKQGEETGDRQPDDDRLEHGADTGTQPAPPGESG